MCVFFAIAATISIPTDSTCVCVTRHADYITAEIVIGTPMKHVSLLVRMDGGAADHVAVCRYCGDCERKDPAL